MKRTIALMLILSLLLSGCALASSEKDNTVTFYYLNADYSYGYDAQVIVPELRETPSSRRDLSYLMALYLMGPADEEHVTPIPAGMRIFKTEEKDNIVTLHLSYPSEISQIRFTLICACLSMTCFDLTDAQTVTIICANQTNTVSRSSLTLYDDSAANHVTEETQ